MKVGGANFWSIFCFQKSVILQAKIDLKKKKKKKKKKNRDIIWVVCPSFAWVCNT